MDTSPERYIRAARRASTERRYAQAIEHFETEWGGLLPASSESVVRYLTHYGDQLTTRESPNKPSVMRESPQHLIRAAHEPDELFRL